MFNLPQIQPSPTRNVECVNETWQYITRNTMEFWVNGKHSASISRGRVAISMEFFSIAGLLACLVHRGIPFGPFTDSKDRLSLWCVALRCFAITEKQYFRFSRQMFSGKIIHFV